MSLRSALLTIGVLTTLAHVVIMILIMAALDRRGQKTNPLLARIYVFKYVRAYKEATIKETGRPGPLYGLWIYTILGALVAVVASILVSRI